MQNIVYMNASILEINSYLSNPAILLGC
jgi:hypothetical protein